MRNRRGVGTGGVVVVEDMSILMVEAADAGEAGEEAGRN